MISLAFVLCSQAASEWPTYHGGYALDGVAAEAPPDRPERLWRFKAEGRVEATPVSAGGKVFFTTSKGALVALDLAGREAWRAQLAKDVFSSPPLCAGGLVIAGSGEGVLHAYDAAKGAEKWTYKVGDNVMGTANLVDLPGGRRGIVAISQTDGSLRCADLETGTEVWKTEPLERCDGSAGVGSGRVAMGSCASALHVFSVEKGEKRGEISLGDDGQVAGGVAIAGGVAYAGTRGGKLCAVDLVGEKLLWTNGDSKQEAFATPAIGERLVVFCSDDGKVYGIKRETGEKAWTFDAGGKPSSPVIAGKRVVVSAGGSIHLLELETGRRVESVKVSDEITSPALVGGMVIVGGDDGTVSAYGRRP